MLCTLLYFLTLGLLISGRGGWSGFSASLVDACVKLETNCIKALVSMHVRTDEVHFGRAFSINNLEAIC